MIIPQVAENLTKSDNIKIPNHCSVCGHTAEIISLKDGEALKCTNPNCKARQISSLEHFVSRDAMNIEGLSEATIEKFIEKGFLNNYTDFYKLERFKDEIINMDGFGEKSYTNLLKAVNKSKTPQLPNFIYALGIDNVGLNNAKLLCKNFNYNLDEIRKANFEMLINIDGFGDVIANSIIDYFKYDENNKLIDEVLNYISFETSEITLSNNKLEDLTFVVTGNVNIYKNRKELQSHIESLGGKVTGSVTSKTNYLINNDINSTSSKNKKAKELNIPIITEEDFINLIK